MTILNDLQSGNLVNLDTIPEATFIEGDVRNQRTLEFAPLDDAQTNILGTLNVLEKLQHVTELNPVVTYGRGFNPAFSMDANLEEYCAWARKEVARTSAVPA